MLGRGVDNLLESGQNVFRDVDPLFLNSDGAIVNLEDPLTTSTTNFKQSVPLKASELRIQRLERYIEEKDKIEQIKKPE